ncbi:protein kinase C-binding protein NELL2-like [Ruditapes philippinarum]|uniref:protein kinase C-binding protein NELL2-like n=1 Tax=Ruditapes philippinarum TaxID=129788 RepID=UPI00295ACD86|nr:protein kinase C-binding protein NELL2-like [Ruditapes philippinarum]
MNGVVRLAIVTFLVRSIYAGYCRTTYSCQGSCLTSQRYYTGCGFLWLSRCTRYRIVYKQCAQTCYRSECCLGYSGNGCSTPLCFGSYSCPNGGKCQSPDMCSCPRGFSSPRFYDINECSTSGHGCQHNCVNTHGSYRCTCRAGYTLTSDLKSCQGI